MPRFLLLFFALPLIFVSADQQPASTKNYTLIWHDEFDGPNGSRPDPAKWTYDLGGGGWGNQELESYTNRPENARVENGNLMITARKESYEGADHLAREYTSARLKTQGLFSQAYGQADFSSSFRLANLLGEIPSDPEVTFDVQNLFRSKLRTYDQFITAPHSYYNQGQVILFGLRGTW